MAKAMMAAAFCSNTSWAWGLFLLGLPFGRPRPHLLPGSKGRPRLIRRRLWSGPWSYATEARACSRPPRRSSDVSAPAAKPPPPDGRHEQAGDEIGRAHVWTPVTDAS